MEFFLIMKNVLCCKLIMVSEKKIEDFFMFDWNMVGAESPVSLSYFVDEPNFPMYPKTSEMYCLTDSKKCHVTGD